jgi:hypothetical protein
MRNLTVTVSDEAYRLGRIWAAEHDTTITYVVRELIMTLPGSRRAARAFPDPTTPPTASRPAPQTASQPASPTLPPVSPAASSPAPA